MNTYIILIPIWGNEHINRCSSYVLSALLASGNIPYLSATNKVEIRFLTTELSSKFISDKPACQLLRKFADISYLLIDDIVNLGEYGLILTMAYERAIRIDRPEQQLKNCYIFLNGDFVLSNNTFETIQTIISSGYNAVVSPSLRVNEKYLQPMLDKIMINKGGIINCSGRELMGYALPNLHPTVIASMINNTDIGTNICHQYFNLVDNEILVARFFLLFMLCIKPECPMPLVSSHCDYSFIPELCPSGNYKVITNSDDALLIELAPIEQETQHIYFRQRNLESDIQRIRSWATKEHINYSTNTIFFHTNGIENIDSKLKSLQHACQELDSILSLVYQGITNNPPISHKFHHFWNNPINILKNQGKLLERESINAKYKFANKIHSLCFKKLFGIQPFVTKMHFKYQDYSNCIKILDSITKNKALNILYICGDRKDFFRKYFDKLLNTQVTYASIGELNFANLKNYDLTFVECNPKSFAIFSEYVISKNIFDGKNTVVYVDLITPTQQNSNIATSLTLLHSKIKMNKIFVSNARDKWHYYLSSIKFMNELYGNRNLGIMLYNFIIFTYSALKITIHNIFKKDLIKNSDLKDISSITISF